MGTVYRARDMQSRHEVALKLLAVEQLEHKEVVERFEREARLMQKFDHPNLVRVIAVGTHERAPYFVMKYVEGATLATLLTEKKRLSIQKTLPIVKRVASALAYVHRQGVVHRDVKPANIHLTETGEVTLLDLGVAREGSSALTRTGAIIGTPRYMAPELILGKTAEPRSDIYSLALVVYEMLTGQAAFPGNADIAVMMAQVNVPAPDPRKVLPHLAPHVAEALLQGLAKDPENRFATAEAFVEALESPPADAHTAIMETVSVGESTSAAQTVLMSTEAEVAPKGEATVLAPMPSPSKGRKSSSEKQTVLDRPVPGGNEVTQIVAPPQARPRRAALTDTVEATDSDMQVPTTVTNPALAEDRRWLLPLVAVCGLVLLGGLLMWWLVPPTEVVPMKASQPLPMPRPPSDKGGVTYGELLVQPTFNGKQVVAVLEVDGVRRGQTFGPVRVEAGKRQVTLTFENARVGRMVEIVAGRQAVVKMELAP